VTTEPGHFDPAGFEDRVEEVRCRIDDASGDPSSVRIVAVTKGFGVDAVDAALSAGLVDVGENYADELVAKASALDAWGDRDAGPAPGPAERAEPAKRAGSAEGAVPVWHFLGAVQRNKVARLAPLVTWWQGVSRIEEGRAIAGRRPGSTVLVQVDVAGIPGRGGCPPERAADLVRALRDEDLDVAGLMAVGRPGPDEEARPGFQLVSNLADSLDLRVRSMGMSDDFEVALAEGSTMVRLGRVLFGARAPYR
jgi:uncharacterized pyridoxal phosphate-containing UPF0001 family protein